MVNVIVEAELLAIKEGQYTTYVFIDNNNNYVMCTRLPNWQVPTINIGDRGFLQYQIVNSGDEYYNPITNEKQTFRYSNVYFNNFIQKSDLIKSDEIIL